MAVAMPVVVGSRAQTSGIVADLVWDGMPMANAEVEGHRETLQTLNCHLAQVIWQSSQCHIFARRRSRAALSLLVRRHHTAMNQFAIMVEGRVPMGGGGTRTCTQAS